MTAWHRSGPRPHSGGHPARLLRRLMAPEHQAECSALAPLRSAAASAACGRWPCLSPGCAPGLGPCGQRPRWPWLGSLRSLWVAPGRLAAGGPPAPVTRPLGLPRRASLRRGRARCPPGLPRRPLGPRPGGSLGRPWPAPGSLFGRPLRRCGLPCAPCRAAPVLPGLGPPSGVRLVPPARRGCGPCGAVFSPRPAGRGGIRPCGSGQGSGRAAFGRP